MRHERIIRRDDGTRIRITVWLFLDYCGSRWTYRVESSAKGKRLWHRPILECEINRLSPLDQKRRYLELASEQEILDTMRELIAQIEPKLE